MAEERSASAVAAIAEPGPLGLGAFALTTFVLSTHNAGWAPDLTWVGLAIFYGGLGQFMAGMWEFKKNNTFGATAFSTYGAFWLGLATFILLVLFGKVPAKDVDNDLGWYLLAFAIFNIYMLAWSARTTVAVFLVFLTLQITEILLFIGFFSANMSIIQAGGIVGVVTALVAWYASAAGVGNNMGGAPVLPVGRPLWNVAAPTATRAAGRA
ncbi:MAG: acetate uptake transporter [Candidatus Dormibacteraeota bacterium]|nr:acetate uptake transporter [Candidatus Dormibacteraeota bacterium]